MTYCIYHIPGVKIGVTNNVYNRVEKQQGYRDSEYEIIEMSDDIDYISQREQELQKKYGYPVDEKLYSKLKCNQMKINVTEMTTTFPCPVNKLKGRLLDNLGMSWDTPFGHCIITEKSIEWIMNNYGNNICLSGGYFQNSIANYEFLKMNNNIFVDPVCHDGGTSIGLAQHLDYKYNNNKPEKYNSLYQGPIYMNQKELLEMYKPLNLNHSKQKYKIVDMDNKEVASLLKQNKCIGIYQGRSEMGPRALGNRSILFNPSNPNAKEKVNLVKNREWFRPYAGTVLYEHTNDWFDLEGKNETPYMSYVVGVKENKINLIPGICHIDNSCRIQTLKKEQNNNFYEIINEFYKLTGIPVLLNTSLNTAGMPLIESIEDVLNMMLKSNIDMIYFPEYKKAVESIWN